MAEVDVQALQEKVELQDRLLEQLFGVIVQLKAQVTALGEILIVADITDSEQITQMEQANLEFVMAEIHDMLEEKPDEESLVT